MRFPQQESLIENIGHLVTVFKNSDARIRPHFHITGPSGSGKSFLVATAADDLEVPIVEINAAQLTCEGVSGNSLSKALVPLKHHLGKPAIVFVDEFDKLFQRGSSTANESQTAVQDEFLTVMENKYTSVFGDYGKYDRIEIDRTLFIFAGAYNNKVIEDINDLREAGVRTEFLGRSPLVLYTPEVGIDDLKNAINETELFNEYLRIFPGVKRRTAVNGVGKIIEAQHRNMNIGIRMISSATHQYFMKRNMNGNLV